VKIVIAVDSFKSTLSSVQAANAIKDAAKYCCKSAQIQIFPMADGGEGTLDAVMHFSGSARREYAEIKDSLLRDIKAPFIIIENIGKKIAVIEMAQIAGLAMLKKDELDVMRAGTYGVGQCITKALDIGAEEIYLGIGGSATNDAGIGMLSALGAKFYDKYGAIIGNGTADIGKIVNIDLSGFDKRIAHTKFISICDVKNPFYGPDGATAVFGPQKGADKDQVILIDEMFKNFADTVYKKFKIDLQNIKGAGAGGGIGAAAAVFLSAEMKTGADWLIQHSGIEKSIKDADIVITGEGRCDIQTSYGKLPAQIGLMCKKYGKKCIIISGDKTISADGMRDFYIESVYAVTDYFTLHEAMSDAVKYLNKTAKIIFDRILK